MLRIVTSSRWIYSEGVCLCEPEFAVISFDPIAKIHSGQNSRFCASDSHGSQIAYLQLDMSIANRTSRCTKTRILIPKRLLQPALLKEVDMLGQFSANSHSYKTSSKLITKLTLQPALSGQCLVRRDSRHLTNIRSLTHSLIRSSQRVERAQCRSVIARVKLTYSESTTSIKSTCEVSTDSRKATRTQVYRITATTAVIPITQCTNPYLRGNCPF